MNSIPLLEAADEQDLLLIEPPLTLELSPDGDAMAEPAYSAIDVADGDVARASRDEQPKSVSGLRTDSLATSVAILVALSIAQRLIGFARQILVCRWLEPDQLGEWDICFKFLMLGAPLAVLGLPGSFGRYLEYYRRRGHLKTFLRRTAAACTILACL
ncbi:MAG TPA: hypothetical protein VGH32_07290, partial [Pirellulales bacterium]